MERYNHNRSFIGKVVVIMIAVFVISGCATNLSKPTRDPMPTKVKLSEFKNVEMKAVGISESFASAEANQKALRKIDEILFRDIRMLFPNFKRIEQGNDFSKGEDRTLQIMPYIKEIKFVGGGARFWVSAMAGSSAVLMPATLRDSSNGEIIADPEFYRSSGAFAGAGTIGATDNRMLEDIAQDIVKYCGFNK